jgi:hypothetical protein
MLQMDVCGANFRFDAGDSVQRARLGQAARQGKLRGAVLRVGLENECIITCTPMSSSLRQGGLAAPTTPTKNFVEAEPETRRGAPSGCVDDGCNS